MNRQPIQILRGALSYDPDIREDVLADGQLFYSKKTKKLYIGDGGSPIKNLKGTQIGLTQVDSLTVKDNIIAVNSDNTASDTTEIAGVIVSTGETGAQLYNNEYKINVQKLLTTIINPIVVGKNWDEETETYAKYLFDLNDSATKAKIKQFNDLSLYDTNSQNFVHVLFKSQAISICIADDVVGTLLVDSTDGSTTIIDNEIILKLENQIISTKNAQLLKEILIKHTDNTSLTDDDFIFFNNKELAYASPIYDKTDNSLKIGLGTCEKDSDGNITNFEFGTGQSQSIATRSDNIEDGHLIKWDAKANKLIDAQFNLENGEGLYSIAQKSEVNTFNFDGFGTYVDPGSKDTFKIITRDCGKTLYRGEIFYFDGALFQVKLDVNKVTFESDMHPQKVCKECGQSVSIESDSCVCGGDFYWYSGDTDPTYPFIFITNCEKGPGLLIGASGNESSSMGASAAQGSRAKSSGFNTIAKGNNSSAEGVSTLANERQAHAEGYKTRADGPEAHAEGNQTYAKGEGSHAEGRMTFAMFDYCHTEGDCTVASGEDAHAEGVYTRAVGRFSHAEGDRTLACQYGTHSEGIGTIAGNKDGHFDDDISGAHAEGNGTVASGSASHAEGVLTKAIGGRGSHAEGDKTEAQGVSSHSEGTSTKAIGTSSHAEGSNTQATSNNSHAEGRDTIASGEASHVEGIASVASGLGAHAEGSGTIAKGTNSHTGGTNSVALSLNGFSHGAGTVSRFESETVFGKYNKLEGNRHWEVLFNIGNGEQTDKELFYNSTELIGYYYYANKDYANPIKITSANADEVASNNEIKKVHKRNSAFRVYKGGDVVIGNDDYVAGVPLQVKGGFQVRPDGSVYAGRSTQDSDGDLTLITKGYFDSNKGTGGEAPDLSEYVKNTDVAKNNSSTHGLVKISESFGIYLPNGASNPIAIYRATDEMVKGRSGVYRPLTGGHTDLVVKEGLSNSKLTWTEEEKASARELLGVSGGGSGGGKLYKHSVSIACTSNEFADINAFDFSFISSDSRPLNEILGTEENAITLNINEFAQYQLVKENSETGEMVVSSIFCTIRQISGYEDLGRPEYPVNFSYNGSIHTAYGYDMFDTVTEV